MPEKSGGSPAVSPYEELPAAAAGDVLAPPHLAGYPVGAEETCGLDGVCVGGGSERTIIHVITSLRRCSTAFAVHSII